MADRMAKVGGAVHVAGAATVAPGQPLRRLLWSPEERLVVSVGLRPTADGHAGPVVEIANRTGAPLNLDARPQDAWGATLEPGDTLAGLELEAGAGALCVQAASQAGADPIDAFVVVLSAEELPEGVQFIGQLFARRIPDASRRQ